MDESLRERKRRHLEICLDDSLSVVSGSTRLDEIRLPHFALPGTDAGTVSLDTPFLGRRLRLPVMISCITGGSDEGRTLNRLLARSAGELGIAIGTGSIRVMLRHPETSSHFALRDLAGDSPILANIGAAQLAEYSADTLIDAVKQIEADGLYVHLNAAQEFFQPGGDLDFGPWYGNIARLAEACPFPVLVKETGAGIPPLEGIRLLDAGVAYVDVAGSGGTDWVAVEGYRSEGAHRQAAESFRNWGYPTGELLLAYRQIARAGGEAGRLVENRIIASGGLRSPRDFAVAIACGGYLGAAAQPFARIASDGGPDAVGRYVESLEIGIRAAMALTGGGTLESLRKSPLAVAPGLADRAEFLAEEALGVGGSHQ